MNSSRRDFLLSLLTLGVLFCAPEIAIADKGSGGGGSSGSGSSGSDSSGSGSSGSGSSGSGSSGDDDEDGGGGGNSGSGGKDEDKEKDKKGKNDELNDLDEDEARKAVKSGKAMPLRQAMKLARAQNDGRIIDVGLVRRSDKFIYVFTVVEPSGRVETLKMDALTGRFAGLLGL